MAIIFITKIYFKISIDDFKSLSQKVAQELNTKDMYNWKIWAIDEKNKIGITIYSLENEDQANNVSDYINTMATLYNSILHRVTTEKYTVLDEQTRLNYGPIDTVVHESQIEIKNK